MITKAADFMVWFYYPCQGQLLSQKGSLFSKIVTAKSYQTVTIVWLHGRVPVILLKGLKFKHSM